VQDVADRAESVNQGLTFPVGFCIQVSQLRIFTAEVTKVAIAVGTEGRLGGQAVVPDALGEWKDLLDNVNLMAGNLTTQVRGIATVTRAIARGDLSQK